MNTAMFSRFRTLWSMATSAISTSIWVLVLAASLAGCAATDAVTNPSGQAQVKPGHAPIPGGYWMYSFGSGQTKQHFENVEVAQSYYGLWFGQKSWSAIGPSTRAMGYIVGLQTYYPLHVRWKLKDGREFILEDIDVPAIMRTYFRTHSLQLQWQRERRSKAIGDGGPTLAHEVNGDTVILKWVITFNRTPVNKRLTPTGAATRWDLVDEEHIVITLKGNPTSGVDFSKKYGPRQ